MSFCPHCGWDCYDKDAPACANPVCKDYHFTQWEKAEEERKPPLEHRESHIEREVCKYARERYGFLTWKFTSPNTAGVPDRVFVTPQGAVYWVEFKRHGVNKLSPEQERRAQDLVMRQQEYVVINDLDRGRAMVAVMSDWNTYQQVKAGEDPVNAPRLVLPAGVRTQ